MMPCLHCGNTVKSINKTGPKRVKFCSSACTWKYRNSLRNIDPHKFCVICETIFYDDSKNNNRVYCSKSCFNRRGFFHKYGLTYRSWKKLTDRGACEICQSVKDLCVDHCHKTKHIRGLLCRKCNTGIGLLKEDVQTLTKAIKYIERGDTNENNNANT